MITNNGKQLSVSIGGQTFVLEGKEKAIFDKELREYINKPNKQGKIEYAPFVSMSPEERKKLDDTYGVTLVDRVINDMSIWKGMHGKTYKSDYMACIKWLQKEPKETVQSQYRKL